MQTALDFSQGLIAGVDEVGRGPLFGRVVTAAVILDPSKPIAGLADSKVLTEKRRDALYEQIRADALSYCIAWASVEEIDRLNILHGTMLAMQRAVAGLHVQPDFVYVDGNRCPELPMPSEPVVKGDSKVACISAASILAKVFRDREVITLAKEYPGYGLEKHKGYPTKQHLEALQTLGVTPFHRRSFKPVQDALKSTV
ncbi:ribonuclease HII [Pokkaliibacter sp. CJK22405]|uniref:ribonuclease HII n=1 Tax=Pokkaliibacter sp. CJK22405 TaxID=3384615 RepID=UPI00398547EC